MSGAASVPAATQIQPCRSAQPRRFNPRLPLSMPGNPAAPWVMASSAPRLS